MRLLHGTVNDRFYGGTHPDATVWVDGQEIKLGARRARLAITTLPDGDFAIPIVAQSPDKVENTATLSFVRGTSRVGDVGATGQPSELLADREKVGRVLEGAWVLSCPWAADDEAAVPRHIG